MKNLKLLASLTLGAATFTANADIVINEVMQSNVYTIMDDIKEFPDSWVELYNNGDTSVDLSGYMIGLDKTPATAYVLPSTHIPVGGHQVFYCDKVGKGLHAHFRVDSGKGDVYLFDKEGNQVDHLSLKKQPAPDVAYGRESDGSDKWGYQLTPTPGKANAGGISSKVLGAVKFSVPGSVWASSRNISLELQMPDGVPENAVIYYTTDGSEPTKASNKYTKPINIRKSMVVRAKVMADGYISIPSNAQSYIFLGRNVNIPVISIAINNEYLYDTKIGILSEGENPPMWGDNLNANYFQDWRRPCNIEYFECEGAESSINQLGETRVQGGYTRRNALKSLAVYANKRFGVKRFTYEFWQKDKPGITDNKSFILRNGGNDFGIAYVRDGLMQRIIGRNTDIDWQGYSPVIVCINGEFHAMLALRERSSEDNIYSNYKGLEDIDMFENWSELKAGNENAMDEFKTFIDKMHKFEDWNDYLNLESYTNLMALNYWVYNTDFPHNNTVMWRRTDGGDSRWRWLVKDCDFGLGIYGHDKVNADFAKWMNDNPDKNEETGYKLWKQLMKCGDFRDYFIDHLVVYMGDFLNAETFLEYTEEIVAENCGEEALTNQKWAGNIWWTPDFYGNVSSMKEWINKRQRNMKTIMRNGWGLGSAVTVKVNKDIDAEKLEGIKVYYDGVPLTKGTFEGYDYVDRTIVLEGSENSNIVGWSVKIEGQDEMIVDTPDLELDIEGNWPITINAIIDESGITDVKADNAASFALNGGRLSAEGHIDVYDIRGRKVAAGYGSATLPAPGVYIVTTADGKSAKVYY